MDRACFYARAGVADDRAILANFQTAPAFHAFCFIDDGFRVDNLDRVPGTDTLAAVRNTTAARIRHRNPVDRTFVASNVDNFNKRWIILLSAERQLDPLGNDRSLLVNTATNPRGVRLNNFFRDRGNFKVV